MIVPWATLSMILEGVGVLLAATGIGGAGAITAAVLQQRSAEETERWFQIGTAIGFTAGIPLMVVTLILLQRSF